MALPLPRNGCAMAELRCCGCVHPRQISAESKTRGEMLMKNTEHFKCTLNVMLVISLLSTRPACKPGTLRVDHVSPLPAIDRALEELIEELDMSRVQKSVKFMLVRREERCPFTKSAQVSNQLLSPSHATAVLALLHLLYADVAVSTPDRNMVYAHLTMPDSPRCVVKAVK